MHTKAILVCVLMIALAVKTSCGRTDAPSTTDSVAGKHQNLYILVKLSDLHLREIIEISKEVYSIIDKNSYPLFTI